MHDQSLLDELTAEMLRLPRDVRARLAEVLIESLDDESGVEKAWIEEAERRYQRYSASEKQAEPIEQVLAKIRGEFNL